MQHVPSQKHLKGIEFFVGSKIWVPKRSSFCSLSKTAHNKVCGLSCVRVMIYRMEFFQYIITSHDSLCHLSFEWEFFLRKTWNILESMNVIKKLNTSAPFQSELNVLMFEWSFHVEKCGRRYTLKTTYNETRSQGFLSTLWDKWARKLRFYLAEGSKLWMVVMKMSTMKAHTRLDLNTSSLIWEYCTVQRRRRRERRKRKKSRRNRFSDKQQTEDTEAQTHQRTNCHRRIQRFNHKR